MEREGTPGRLGVLPSPRLEGGFGSMSEMGGILGVGAVVGGQESEMRREGEGEEASEKSELEIVPASPSRYRIVNPETLDDQRPAPKDEVVEAHRHREDNLEEHTANFGMPTQGLPAPERDAIAEPKMGIPDGQARTAYQGKVSALTSLPNQQRTHLPSVPAITPLTNILSDDELYENVTVPREPPAQWREKAARDPSAAPGQYIDRPATRQADETSEGSARDFSDAQETHEKPDATDDKASRRSSASSIGRPETEVGRGASRLLDDRINRSSQASLDELLVKSQAPPDEAVTEFVPILPMPSRETDLTAGAQQPDASLPQTTQTSLRRPSSQPEHLMKRSSEGRMIPPGRAIPYAPLGDHERGMPEQERLIAVTVDPPSEPPAPGGLASETPSDQRHPSHHQSQASEYEKVRREHTSDIAPSRSFHTRQSSRDGPERTSRRFSGFFRGSNPTSPTIEPMPMLYAPPPHAIGPDFGLENLDPLGADAVLNPSRDDLAGEPGREEKRRSGIWQSMKRSSSVSRTAASRTVSMPNTSAELDSGASAFTSALRAATDGMEQSRTLNKPQRSATTTLPPTDEPKRKRFSSLGSIFGRSGTHGRGSPKPNKLQKSPPFVSGARRVSAPIGGQTSYEAFEAQRPQNVPEIQGWQNASQNPQPYAQPSLPDGTAPFSYTPLQASGQPPPQGWYGPGGDDPHVKHPHQQGQQQRQQLSYSVPALPEAQQPYRQLHSEAWRRGMQNATLPEAFRPVESSYGGRPQPSGPPSHDRPTATSPPPSLNRQPTLPTQQPLWRGNAGRELLDPPGQRQTSAGAAGTAYSPRLPQQRTVSAEEDFSQAPVFYEEPQGYRDTGTDEYEAHQSKRSRRFSAPSAQSWPAPQGSSPTAPRTAETSRSLPEHNGLYPPRRQNYDYSFSSPPFSPPPGSSTHPQARAGAQTYEAGPRQVSVPLPQQQQQRQRYYAHAPEMPR